jgi:hypothetical protein
LTIIVNKVVNDIEVVGNEAQEVNENNIDVKVVGNEALFMNVNEVVHELEGVNVVPADEARGFNGDEDYEYLPSYLSGDDESFMDLDMDVKPNNKSNKTSTRGQGTCINVEENVAEK